MEQCPYLYTRSGGKRTSADEWGELLRDTALRMDARAKQMQLERWFAVPLLSPPKKTAKKSKQQKR